MKKYFSTSSVYAVLLYICNAIGSEFEFHVVNAFVSRFLFSSLSAVFGVKTADMVCTAILIIYTLFLMIA